jgi:hypothetical protein
VSSQPTRPRVRTTIIDKCQARHGYVHGPRHKQAQEQRREMEVRITPHPHIHIHIPPHPNDEDVSWHEKKVPFPASIQTNNTCTTSRHPQKNALNPPLDLSPHVSRAPPSCVQVPLTLSTQIHEREGNALASGALLALQVRSSPLHTLVSPHNNLTVGRCLCGTCGASKTWISVCCSRNTHNNVRSPISAWVEKGLWCIACSVCLLRSEKCGTDASGHGWMERRVQCGGIGLCNDRLVSEAVVNARREHAEIWQGDWLAKFA